jgi:uncharacterized membrane protein
MPMKNFLKWALATFILAAGVHFALVITVPYFIMSAIPKKLQKAGTKINTFKHLGPVSGKSRGIVMPSPDLLYTIGIYDVSENPIRITAKVPDTYWSLSFYQSNSDNFFVINDEQIPSKEIQVIVVGKGRSYTAAGKELVVESPSDTGVILIRTLIKDRKKLDDLISIQKAAKIEEII